MILRLSTGRTKRISKIDWHLFLARLEMQLAWIAFELQVRQDHGKALIVRDLQPRHA